jgi:hypothetical protein
MGKDGPELAEGFLPARRKNSIPPEVARIKAAGMETFYTGLSASQ